MDASQYQLYKRGELAIVFLCQQCTEKNGKKFTGHVDIFKPASINTSIEQANSNKIYEDILAYVTPPRPVLVNYSLTMTLKATIGD